MTMLLKHVGMTMFSRRKLLVRSMFIFIAEVNKIGFHPFDDKRYILKDGITTLAHEHYRFVKMIEYCMHPLYYFVNILSFGVSCYILK